MKNYSKSLINDGFIRLSDYAGSDLSVVNHARISLARFKEVLELEDEKLIDFLMKNKHATPFEAGWLSFHVRAPIAVAREWMRHRYSSFSEMSTRYVKVKEKIAFIPASYAIRTQVGKPGAYTFVPINDPEIEQTVVYKMQRAYETAFKTYDELLELGVAREVARNVLPLGLYTEFYYDVNPRSLMNFLSLRNSPHALLEIREYASIIEEEIFAEIFPVTYDSFLRNGRIAI